MQAKFSIVVLHSVPQELVLEHCLILAIINALVENVSSTNLMFVNDVRFDFTDCKLKFVYEQYL